MGKNLLKLGLDCLFQAKNEQYLCLDLCLMREFELLQHVYKATGKSPSVLIPPGDDMAMVQVDGANWLAAVDQLVEARHFDLSITPVHLIGRKAITRCLSDIAAMAAIPVACLGTITSSPNTEDNWAAALFDAMNETANEYNCPLIGGDVAVHSKPESPMVLTVTALAKPGANPPIRRSGAKVGDYLYVTGKLGGSVDNAGLGSHLTFEPRIKEALALSEILGKRLHAMIDISDGLGRDASHIAEQSKVAIEIDADLLPINDGLDWLHAMSDGEDYELCFAAEGNVPTQIDDLPITQIGRIVALNETPKPLVIVNVGSKQIDATSLGWEHGNS